MADVIGVTRVTVSRWAKGPRTPPDAEETLADLLIEPYVPSRVET